MHDGAVLSLDPLVPVDEDIQREEGLNDEDGDPIGILALG